MIVSPRTALQQVLETAAIAPSRVQEISLSGKDPILPTRFPMGTAGAAALGAVGLAAADLWRLRGGGSQEVASETRRGAAALRGTHYLQIPARDNVMFDSPLSGFHRTKDGGWIQLHCEFPHFRDGIRRVLSLSDDSDAPAAIAAWDGVVLEDALASRGLPGFVMRDNATWAAHPQAKDVAALPLLEIIKIGDAPSRPLFGGERPLSNIRVLDLTRVIAGPMTGRTLAEHGADVLRISAPHLPSVEQLVIETGHAKRNAEIDLSRHEGRDALRELVTGADIFSQSYRPGSLAARGFGPDELAALRPGIIYVSLSAWSHIGPWAGRRGYDSLVQCASGIAHEHGQHYGDNAPKHLPGQALDYLAGYLGAFGAMVALHHRAREGGSWLVRLSLAQAAHWLKSLGRVDVPDGLDLTPENIAELIRDTDTAWGRITHLGPVLQMSGTPPRWAHPPAPLGSHEAAWLP